MNKKKKLQSYYGDIVVIQRSRLRVQFNATKPPTKEEMFILLHGGDIEDITDDENLDYISVESVDKDWQVEEILLEEDEE